MYCLEKSYNLYQSSAEDTYNRLAKFMKMACRIWKLHAQNFQIFGAEF